MAFACSVCGKEVKATGIRAGSDVPTLGVHARCRDAKVVIAKLPGEGAKKQAKKLEQIGAAAKVKDNKATGGKNEFKRTGTHHDPTKIGSKTGQQQHFSKGGNAARAKHDDK